MSSTIPDTPAALMDEFAAPRSLSRGLAARSTYRHGPKGAHHLNCANAHRRRPRTTKPNSVDRRKRKKKSSCENDGVFLDEVRTRRPRPLGNHAHSAAGLQEPLAMAVVGTYQPYGAIVARRCCSIRKGEHRALAGVQKRRSLAPIPTQCVRANSATLPRTLSQCCPPYGVQLQVRSHRAGTQE